MDDRLRVREPGVHHQGMNASQTGTIGLVSTQIAVRLPDSMVAFIDELVAGGEASRAAVVTKALMRYRRQLDGDRDAEIYLKTGGYPELDGWIADRTDLRPLD